MQRSLGRFELAQILTDELAPLNAVIIVHLAPSPDPAALTEALSVLRRRHPLLSAHVSKAGGAYAFTSEGTPEIPLRFPEWVGPERWREVAEAELNCRFKLATGPLVRVTCLRAPETGDRSQLVVTFQHAIMDGTSGTHLIHELLDLCAGGGGDAAPAAVLPAVETRFPAAFRGWRRVPRMLSFLARQMADEAVYRYETRGGEHPGVNLEAKNRIHSFRVSAEVARRLVRRSRSERVSLNSVLGASTLLAVAKGLHGEGPRPLRSVLFPDLRPYLRPPIEERDLASCFALMRLTTRVDPAQDVWELARRLNGQARHALRRGDKYAAFLLSPWMMRASLRSRSERMAHVAVSYAGRLAPAAAYGPMRLEGAHAFVSNVPIGPQYTALIRLSSGQLWWDAAYLDTDLDAAGAEAVASDIRRRLEAGL